jgi:hypothetical protein
MIGATQLLSRPLNPHGPQIVTNGLVTRLESFDQGYTSSTTQWDDLSGNNNHFTKTGNVTLTDVNGTDMWYFHGGYFNFKRPSDNANNGYGVFNLDNFTIEIWVNYVHKYATLATPWLWSYDYVQHSSPHYAQYVRINNYDNTSFGGYNSGSGGAGSVYGGNWYQLVTTRVGGTTRRGKTYVNGAVVNASANSTRELITATGYQQEAWIGRGNYGSYGGAYTSFLKGYIGIFRFYNREITASEVLQNYNENKASFGLT